MLSGRWRWRVALTVVPPAVALLSVALVVPTRPDLPDPVDVPRASQSTCLPTGEITSVRQIDRLVRTVRGNPEFAGGDVGTSARLQDGRFLFLFGDTLRSAAFDGQRFVRNSMLVFSPGCAQVILPADHGALVPDRPDGVGYWPMSTIVERGQGFDLVGVAVQRVRSTGTGVFDFETLGPARALFVVPSGGTPQLLGVTDLGPDLADPTRPMWGAATDVAGGWVYTYGTSRAPGSTAPGFELRVARHRPVDFDRTEEWTYWDGSSWQRDPARSAALIPAVGGVSQTLSVFHREGTWYALSKRDEFLGSDLVIWTAPAPTGPFTAGPPVAQIPSDSATGTLRYLALAHPGLLPRRGTVVVSYSENNLDLSVVQDDPRRYRPRFLRVPLPAG